MGVDGKMDQKILVIVPAFNEEDSVEGVVRHVRTHFPQMDVLVVNDGSTDRTAEKARRAAAIVLDLPYNLGIGGAMQAGYKYAYEKGYDIAIQVDGDGQHNPREIPKLLKGLSGTEADIVIGSRFIGDLEYKSSRMRKVGISILSKVISLIVRQRITDPTSGFRAADRKAIRLFAFHYPQDYPEPEVVVLLSRWGLKITEVPVAINQRFSGESSITGTKSIYYMVKVLLAVFVDCFKSPFACRRFPDAD